RLRQFMIGTWDFDRMARTHGRVVLRECCGSDVKDSTVDALIDEVPGSVLANCASLLTNERPGPPLSISGPGLDQDAVGAARMTHSLISVNPRGIERLPAGGLPGFCCDDRNCAPCLRAYRRGLALLGETSGKSVPVAPRKPRQSSPDGL